MRCLAESESMSDPCGGALRDWPSADRSSGRRTTGYSARACSIPIPPPSIKVDAKMTIILRSIVYVVILSASSVYSWSAKADARPPYSGPSVSVPFVNATDVSNPLLYVSPQIAVGFKGSNSTAKHPAFSVTMDTGSVGIIVGSSYFTPPTSGRLDSSFVGPGSETLTSSGIIFTGDWYKAVVNLYSGATIVAQSTVPVMAVTHVACEMDARACDPKTLDSSGAETHYFGIGFAGGSGQPQGTPDKNAFLNVTSISGSDLLPSPGYILSTQGVQIGLTSINTQGFAMIKLEPLLAPDATQWQTAPASASVLTDWQHARGTITVNGRSGSGGILFDTGVTTAFLTSPIGATPTTGMGPSRAECNGSSPPSCAVSGTRVQVSLSNQIIPVAWWNYTVGANNGAQSGNPVSPFAVSVEQNGSPFLNTTVRFLQAFVYLYDAANGFIGLKTTGTTPAQYATSTPSGLAVDGVFQCFFTWAGAAFGSPLIALQATKYSWPYTYRYDPVTQTYIGISSGNSNTPATNANHVYFTGADGQSTDEGALSGWLSAVGCQ
jgi:hypothetical protein